MAVWGAVWIYFYLLVRYGLRAWELRLRWQRIDSQCAGGRGEGRNRPKSKSKPWNQGVNPKLPTPPRAGSQIRVRIVGLLRPANNPGWIWGVGIVLWKGEISVEDTGGITKGVAGEIGGVSLTQLTIGHILPFRSSWNGSCWVGAGWSMS